VSWDVDAELEFEFERGRSTKRADGAGEWDGKGGVGGGVATGDSWCSLGVIIRCIDALGEPKLTWWFTGVSEWSAMPHESNHIKRLKMTHLLDDFDHFQTHRGQDPRIARAVH
jgi:hypothetical protein